MKELNQRQTIIQINHNLRIRHNGSFFTIEEKVKVKKIEISDKCEYWTDRGFYRDIYGCLKKLLLLVEPSNDGELRTYINEIEEMFKVLKAVGVNIEEKLKNNVDIPSEE